LVLRGSTTWSAGSWGVGRGGQDTGIGGTIENRGALRITGNTRVGNFGVGGGVVRNLPGATITRANAAGSAEIAVPLDNDGAVSVESGTLLLQGGSGSETSDGSFAVADGAELNSFGGTSSAPARG
jgi:hypothetical protein